MLYKEIYSSDKHGWASNESFCLCVKATILIFPVHRTKGVRVKLLSKWQHNTLLEWASQIQKYLSFSFGLINQTPQRLQLSIHHQPPAPKSKKPLQSDMRDDNTSSASSLWTETLALAWALSSWRLPVTVSPSLSETTCAHRHTTNHIYSHTNTHYCVAA